MNMRTIDKRTCKQKSSPQHTWLWRIAALMLLAQLVPVSVALAKSPVITNPKVAVDKVVKSDSQWRQLLTPQQYEILRKSGTEKAFENRYHDHKRSGTYACVACGNRLFLSKDKFNSGTGWPSFSKTIDSAAVIEREDNTLFSRRTEVVCARCEGHLGHVFSDGPKPTGLRYCLNSAAMTFFPAR